MKKSKSIQNFIDLNCKTIQHLLHLKGLTIDTYKILFQHFASQKIDFDDTDIECSKGCGYCCYLRVSASLPEIFVILNFLETTDQFDHFIERAEKLEIQEPGKTSTDPEWWIKRRVPCLFLDEEKQLCTIYEVRPFSCRGYHSLDKQRCQEGYLQKSVVNIPCYSDVKKIWLAYSISFQKTIQQLGRQPGQLELSSSIAHLLKNYYLVSTWFTNNKLLFIDEEITE